LGVFLLTLLGSFLTACSSTTVVDHWRDAEYVGPPLQTLLVIGMSKEAGRRRQFEDAMVQQIDALEGASALASYQLIPSEEALEKEQIVAAIAGREIDGVLITRLVSEDKRKRYVQPHSVGPTGHGYYGHYYRSYNAVYSPGYLTEDTIVTLETNLYATDTEKLVWSGTTESFDPESATQIIDELAKLVVERLTKEKLI
jgi:hypothetical protein